MARSIRSESAARDALAARHSHNAAHIGTTFADPAPVRDWQSILAARDAKRADRRMRDMRSAQSGSVRVSLVALLAIAAAAVSAFFGH